ncbi:MAG: hypothetical protein HYS23_14725 [Geobacter sp.]|nr:hypothetical protein [Geobacter sp.]
MGHAQTPVNKIARPRVSGIFQRERLFHLLDEALERPVVWISGPGGSGKTTLVASYLDVRRLPCLWYQVDEGDADVATLFHYLGLAAERAAPLNQHSLPHLTPEHLTALNTFARRWFENLFGRLTPPYVLVLDDYHEVGEESIFHEVVKHALTEVPRGINVVIVSRKDPPPLMARLCAGKQMSFVGWDELRLTAEETEGIVQLHDKSGEWGRVPGRLHEKVQGWVAGLVLLLERGKADELEQWLEGKRPQQDIFNYFAEELFNKAEVRIRDFLLKTALLPTIAPNLAEKLADNADAARILEELHSSNFFTEKRHDRELLYRFHPLFREYLLNKLDSTYEPSCLARLKRTASELLEESGRIEEAASLCIDAEDWERLAGIILGHAQTLVTQGRNRTVLEWLDCLPPSLLEQAPYLLYWQGVCKMTCGFAEARVIFERAFPLFDARQDAAGLYLSWSGIVDSIVYEWADFSRLDIWIERLTQLMRRYPQFPSEEIEGRVAGSVFGALMFHMPQHPEIDAWAERIFALTQGGSDPAYRIMVGNQLALYHLWWTGDHTKLGMVMDLLQPPNEGDELPPLARIIWTCLRGFQEWVAGSSLEAQMMFQEGLRIANQSGVHVWDFMLYFQGIISYLGEGDYRTGKKYLDELIARVDRTQHMNMAHYCYVAAWQAALAGEPVRALEYAQTAVETAEHLGGPFTHSTVHAALAQTNYLSGNRDEAMSSLEKSIEMARSIKTPLLLYRNLMVKAYFLLDSGKEEACIETLREALPIGSAGRYMNFSWWIGPITTRLCLKALEAGIEVDYVLELIRRRNLVPEKPPLHIENWPWPVRIYTLGRFAIERDGMPLEFSGKVQKKPLELLKALVALGGAEAAEGQLADLLWPEADGDSAKNSFKVTLHRLREILGVEKALQLRDGKLVMDRRHFWVDAWAFDGTLTSAQQKAAAGNEAEALRLAEKGLALYRGDFLSEDGDRLWALSLRKSLKSRFIRNIVAVGGIYRSRIDLQQAISCYLKGLEVDDTAEEFYQNLMQLYAEAGLKGEAVSTYQRCRKTLALSLGITPSRKTEQIYNSLLIA